MGIVCSVVSDRSPVLQNSSSVASGDDEEVKVVLQSETLEELRQYVNSGFHNSESLLIKMTRLTLEGHDKEGHVRSFVCSIFTFVTKPYFCFPYIISRHLTFFCFTFIYLALTSPHFTSP